MGGLPCSFYFHSSLLLFICQKPVNSILLLNLQTLLGNSSSLFEGAIGILYFLRDGFHIFYFEGGFGGLRIGIIICFYRNNLV